MPLTPLPRKKIELRREKPSGDLAHANTRRQTRADLNPTHSKKKSKETLRKYDENSSLFQIRSKALQTL